MKEKDFPKFGSILATLAELIGAKLSKEQIKIYYYLLEKFTINEIEKAVKKIMSDPNLKYAANAKRLPMPGEIIEKITGNLEDIATEQAAKVLESVKRHGPYNSIWFEDKCTSAVIQQVYGGWIKLCQDLKADDDKWFIKEFIKYYQSYKRENIYYEHHLSGLTELNNSSMAMGYIPKPIMIGWEKSTRRRLIPSKIDKKEKGIPNYGLKKIIQNIGYKVA